MNLCPGDTLAFRLRQRVTGKRRQHAETRRPSDAVSSILREVSMDAMFTESRSS